METLFTKEVLVVCGVLLFLDAVHGHGTLVDPPGRNFIMFLQRSGSSNTITCNNGPKGGNTNHMSQFCGGTGKQKANGGKCGACGDDWAEPYPRAHDYNPNYNYDITPTRVYLKGQIIKVKVTITASHKGYFNFKLCNKLESREENAKKDVLTKCFSDPSQYILLRTPEGVENYGPIDKTADYSVSLKLPDDVSCPDGCSLQWWYRTGNSWGCDAPGDCGLGKGTQEHFVNCADIMIVDCLEYEMMNNFNPKLWCGYGPTDELKKCDTDADPWNQPDAGGNTSPGDYSGNGGQPTCEQCTQESRSACPNSSCQLQEKTFYTSKTDVPDLCCEEFCSQAPSLCPMNLCKSETKTVWVENTNYDNPSAGDNTNYDNPSGGGNINYNNPSGGDNTNYNNPSGWGDTNYNPSGGDNTNYNPSGGDNTNYDNPSGGGNTNYNNPSGGGNTNYDNPSGGDNTNYNPSGGGSTNNNNPSGGGNTNNDNTFPTCAECTKQHSTTCTNPCCERKPTYVAIDTRATDTWCMNSCNHVPKYCPQSFCANTMIWVDNGCNRYRALETVLRELIDNNEASEYAKQKINE